MNAGNACVAHGPWPNNGAGNLFTAYTGSVDPVGAAVSDINQNVEYLRQNGLLVPGADSCYIWPQGTFQQSANDTTLLEAAIAAGYTCARAADVFLFGFCADAASKYGRMAMPIIGHTFGNGTMTTAAEATNITNIQAAIAALTTNKTDAFLMLHRVQPTATADGSMSSIGIRHADLETLATTIKTAIDAGTLEAVTMPEIAIQGGGWWGRL